LRKFCVTEHTLRRIRGPASRTGEERLLWWIGVDICGIITLLGFLVGVKENSFQNL